MKSEHFLQVQIIFSDGSQLLVTMKKDKLQREYSLNGRKSTAKHVKEFLLSKGIHLYSENPPFLIQQNSISLIPNMNSIQLADLIQDANGSLLFDLKVRKAEKKLEDWESLETEMTKNLSIIEKKFRDWENYKINQSKLNEIKETCKLLESKIALWSDRENKILLEEMDKKIIQFNHNSQDINREIHLLLEKRDYISNSIQTSKESLEMLRKQSFNSSFHENFKEKTKQKEILSLISNEIEDQERSKLKLDTQIQKLKYKLNVAIPNIDKSKDELIEKQEIIDQIKIQISKLDSEIIHKKKELKCNDRFDDNDIYDIAGVCLSDHSVEKIISELENKYDSLCIDILKKEQEIPYRKGDSIKNIDGVLGYSDELVNWREAAMEYSDILSSICESTSSIVLNDSKYISSAIEKFKSLRLYPKIWTLDRIRVKDLEIQNNKIRDSCNCSNIQVVHPLDLVEMNTQYNSIYLKLFSNLVICRNDDDAHRISSILDKGLVYSYSSGNIHKSVGSSISGGFIQNEVNLVKNEINRNKIILEIENLKNKREIINFSIRKLKEIESIIISKEEKTILLSEHMKNFEELVTESGTGNTSHLMNKIKIAEEESEKIQKELFNLISNQMEEQLKYEKICNLYELQEKENKLTENQINSIKDCIRNMKNELDELIQKKEELVNRNNHINNKLNKLLNKKKDIESKINNSSDYEEELDSELSLEALKNELRLKLLEKIDLKKELKANSFKNNLTSFENQWIYLKNRFTEMQQEKKDLKNYIGSSREEIRKSTLESFHSISKLFSKYVSQLLPGKTGRLLLIQENDVKHGVQFEIKENNSICTISQLSGGQKTLLAVSFIFSIGGLVGTPFFLLDEIDAALDESNQMRLALFLKQFSESGQQLIFVSHHANFQQLGDKKITVDMNEATKSSKILI